MYCTVCLNYLLYSLSFWGHCWLSWAVGSLNVFGCCPLQATGRKSEESNIALSSELTLVHKIVLAREYDHTTMRDASKEDGNRGRLQEVIEVGLGSSRPLGG